ncbi:MULTISPECIES: FKBP-type peptidyl-prolyl cis-trans isomerase [Halolamina]|uniref:Peptidyl-prolyl cis-trans isomerase n=1 Tax=Halolamina pelagica TaxID=699431 RepID=A0A1I5MWP2_9EURY|nr:MULTISPECIES: peptidylprolyl isomerase [Halolamina]NHX36195.1 peptidylprolyl isomerase [Halolamina sp. R1-12]SFP13954.1 FKBP-type peptidyl-prolyl cis-trans isomerase SlyD [Halolamina pelagica]
MSENEADAEADTANEAEAETESGIQDGDFVRIDYNVRTVSDDRVVDTTRQDVAEEAGIDDDEYDFSPRIIVVGEGHVFPGVDDALIGGEVGDEGTVDISAEDGFGEYDEEEVRTVSANKLDEEDRRPGAQVQIDGEQGYVETVIGGRARVDFNHPLAGEDLEYEYEIVDVVDDDEEKAAGLLGMYLQMEPDLRIETETVEEEVTVEDDDGEETTETEEVEQRSLYIEATQQMQMNQQWMFQKQQVADDLMDRLDLDRVVVEEVFDGSAGGMMGGMGGMMGGMGGAEELEEELEDIEGDLEDADVDAEEIVDELDDE